jgi:hypothetical protein
MDEEGMDEEGVDEDAGDAGVVTFAGRNSVGLAAMGTSRELRLDTLGWER